MFTGARMMKRRILAETVSRSESFCFGIATSTVVTL